MAQVTARMRDSLVKEIDDAARRLKRTRVELLRQAVVYYLEDLEDLTLGLERLQDPADPVLEWDEVRRELVDPDQR
jgi:transposase